MKNRLKKHINKYSSGKPTYEYYKNPKGQLHSHYEDFWSNGQKDFEGSCNFDIYIGLWKWYEYDGRREWIDTWKNGLNGIKIEFKFDI